MTPATTTPFHPCAGGRLILLDSTPPRLMVAPLGVRLPPGVHEVAPLLLVPAARTRARAVVAAARGDGTVFGFSSSAPAPAPAGVHCVGAGARVVGAAAAAGLGGAGPTASERRHLLGFPATATPRGARNSVGVVACCTAAGTWPAPGARVMTVAGLGLGGAPSAAGEHDMFGMFRGMATRCCASTTNRARPVVAVAAPGICFAGGAASTGIIAFAAASPGDGPSRGSARSYVTHALHLGDDGGGEEDPSDELSYQQAQREMQAAVYMVCLRRRIEVASDLGLLPSGRERRLLEEEVGEINAAGPVYHWVISRCHDHLKDILGTDLYKKIVVTTPKEEAEFEWVVKTDSKIIVSVTTFMADIRYSIMHNETWRAVVRDHPLYDMCPLFLNKLAGSVAEFSTNIALACFKRPSPPVLQRMVENHALAVVHLYETLLDLYEVLSSGEQATDPKRTKELLMRYDFLFVQDLHPQDYIAGVGDDDAEDLLFLLDTLKPEIRNFRGTWM